MGKTIQIRRNVRSLDGTYHEKIEKAELVSKNKKTVIVRLSNGDVIKRKNRDVVRKKEKDENIFD